MKFRVVVITLPIGAVTGSTPPFELPTRHPAIIPPRIEVDPAGHTVRVIYLEEVS